jgi:trehalose 6-phosphate phosphatase
MPSAAWAYFLDMDGTLVDLAPTPDSVIVDASIRAMIDHLNAATGGALAIISGRSIAALDAMFGPTHLAIAGQHGLERRMPSGEVHVLSHDASALQRGRDFITQRLVQHPALILEDKGQSLALHYRGASALAGFAHRLMRAARHLAGSGYHLQSGKRVVELLPEGADKGGAIRAFMSEPPFRGRVPMFIGDDRTDESGFAFVNSLGGVSIKVGQGPTQARWSMPHVGAVRTWLLTVRPPVDTPTPHDSIE